MSNNMLAVLAICKLLGMLSFIFLTYLSCISYILLWKCPADSCVLTFVPFGKPEGYRNSNLFYFHF